MKKVISIIITITLLIAMISNFSYAAEFPIITVSQIEAERGGEIVVPVRITGNTGICGATLSVTYDGALQLKKIEKGNALSGLVMTKPGKLTSNPVRLVWDGIEEDSSNGTIAELTFSVPDKAGEYAVSISYEDRDIVNGNLEPVTVILKNGFIRVSDRQPTENPFFDVKSGVWFYDSVIWAVKNNITSGTSSNTFSPDMTCSRAQVVTFLWRAAGMPEPTKSTNPFTDVRSGQYYYKAVLWAVENGITTGMSETTFEPDTACSRGQVVTFQWRAANKPEITSITNPFTDVRAGSYYYKAVLWAVENQITNGMTETEFEPSKSCTRSQIVTFLYRQSRI